MAASRFAFGLHQCAAALFACAAGAAAAQAAAPVTWDLSGAVRYRSLTESSSAGRLVKETGPMARLALDAQLNAAGWPVLALGAAIAEGRLDYEGRDQSGQPLDTKTRHTDREFDLRWRPVTASWGELWLGVGWLQNRRNIASTTVAGGLVETSSFVMPGIAWRSAPFTPGGMTVPLQFEARLRASARHRLDVDYLGVFDESHLRGGRRNELTLGLGSAPSTGWRWNVDWTHSRQSASADAALYRAGATVGTVRQPRIRMDDLTLSIAQRF
jgi:hypothetical protein